MGCGPSLTSEEKSALRRSKALSATIEKEAEIEASKIKLLLLGAGESGSSRSHI